MKDNYTPYKRNPETGVRYWAIPGQEGYMHILGGLAVSYTHLDVYKRQEHQEAHSRK